MHGHSTWLRLSSSVSSPMWSGYALRICMLAVPEGALVVVAVRLRRHRREALAARRARPPARLTTQGVVPLHAPGRRPRPGEPAPTLARIRVEDRPVVMLLTRAWSTAFRAVQGVDFHAAVSQTPIIVVPILVVYRRVNFCR